MKGDMMDIRTNWDNKEGMATVDDLLGMDVALFSILG